MNKNSLKENINQVLLYDEETEQEVLGFLLINNKNIDYVQDFLPSEDCFHFDFHKKIFKIIIKLIEKNYTADEKTLYFELYHDCKTEEEKNNLKKNIEYLIGIAASSTSNVLTCAKIVYNFYLKRKLWEISGNIKRYLEQEDVQDAIQNVEEEIFGVTNQITNQANKNFNSFISSVKEKLKIAKENEGNITGVKTHLKELDFHIGGLQKSDLIILAARPSMGKTALALNIAKNVAEELLNNPDNKKDYQSIAFFSLEMSGDQLAARILASEVELSVKTIHTARDDENKKISDKEFNKIIETAKKLEKLSLFIDDSSALSISQFRTRARYLKRKHKIGLIIIDYLQLMHSPKFSGNRIQEIADITKGLKSVAKELNIPVIALSQLSRAVEANERKDKRPRLSDLRESGTIEQDADIVMFLYREGYYLEREEKHAIDGDAKSQEERLNWQDKLSKVKNIAELIIAKNRNGSIGNIQLFFNTERMIFDNLKTEDKQDYKNINNKSNYPKIDRQEKVNFDHSDDNSFEDIPDEIKNLMKPK